MIISVHIPKTGGTSFRNFLIKAFNKKVVFDYRNLYNKPKLIGSSKTIEKIPLDTKVIHGHFKADKYDDLFPNAKLITWFRNPLEIPISLYYHFLRCPNFKNSDCKALYDEKMSLKEFVLNIGDGNRSPYFISTKELVDFDFIGITEMYDKSMRLFRKLFHIDNSIPVIKENINPQKNFESKYRIDPEIRKLIRKLFIKDYKLYLEAIDIFNKKYIKEFKVK